MSDQKTATAMLPIRHSGVALNTLDDMQRMAKIFIASGLFEITDRESAKGIAPEVKIAQAVVKIQAGMELGIPPFTAMKDISIIRGKTQLSYQLILSKVRQTPGYNYKVIECSDEAARIEFFLNKESLGISNYNMEDARRSGVPLDMYKKYPRNMLMARAASNGVNMFCPEVVRGSVYTPEDFGGVSSEEEAVIVEVEKKTVAIPSTTEELREAATADEPKSEVISSEDDEESITKAQIAGLIAMAVFRGYTEEELYEWLEKNFGVNDKSLNLLTREEYFLAEKHFSKEKKA